MTVVTLLQKILIRLILAHWNFLNKQSIYSNLSLFTALEDYFYAKTRTSNPVGGNMKEYHVFGCFNNILISYHRKRFIRLLSALKYMYMLYHEPSYQNSVDTIHTESKGISELSILD